MLTVFAIVHVIFCFLLISLVLLQDPKGGGAGGMFGGGSSNSLFGATGAVTFLTRLTRYSAIIFGCTCIILTLLSRPEQGSVLDSTPANASQTAPVNPAAPAAAASTNAPAQTETAPAKAAEAPATAPAAATTNQKK